MGLRQVSRYLARGKALREDFRWELENKEDLWWREGIVKSEVNTGVEFRGKS